MITDHELTFSDEQAVTAAAASANVLDFGPMNANNVYRRIGDGMQPTLWLVLTVTETMDDDSDNSTLAVKWETDTDEAFGSAVNLWDIVTIPAVSAAGTQFKYRLPAAAYERFNRLYYTPANGNLSAGKLKAQIMRDVTMRHDYHSEGGSNAD